MRSFNPGDVRLERAVDPGPENAEGSFRFSFLYPRPFLRRHSISFGAHGVVEVSTLPDEDSDFESAGLGTEVRINKASFGRSASGRHLYDRYFTMEELINRGILPYPDPEETYSAAGIELISPGDETVKSVARLAVVDSLATYRQEQHAIFDFLRGDFARNYRSAQP